MVRSKYEKKEGTKRDIRVKSNRPKSNRRFICSELIQTV